MIKISAPIRPRLFTGDVVLIKNMEFEVSFWMGGNPYFEFELLPDKKPSDSRKKTEEEVAEMINLKRVIVLKRMMGS